MKRLAKWIYLPILVMTLSLTPGCSDDNNSNVGTPPPVAQPGTAPTTPPTSNAVAVSIPQGAMNLGNQAFGTNPLVIQMGTTVTWTNNDTVPHTVTANDGSFDSGTLQAGGTFSHTFTTEGTFNYACTIHPNMTGALQVDNSGASPSPSESPSPSPSQTILPY